jgi:hypothetical protein
VDLFDNVLVVGYGHSASEMDQRSDAGIGQSENNRGRKLSDTDGAQPVPQNYCMVRQK